MCDNLLRSSFCVTQLVSLLLLFDIDDFEFSQLFIDFSFHTFVFFVFFLFFCFFLFFFGGEGRMKASYSRKISIIMCKIIFFLKLFLLSRNR